jgi:Flagellar hook-length control protein FliK
MQSALAFLSIPSAVTESRVPPEVQISTSDSSFADAVLLSEGDIQSKDAAPVDALPVLAWISLPVSPVALPPPSLAAASEAGLVAVDPAEATAFAAESLLEAGLDAGNSAPTDPIALPGEGFAVPEDASVAGLADKASKPLMAEDAPALPVRPDAVAPPRSTNPENPGLPAGPVVDAQVTAAPQAILPSSVEVSVQPDVTPLASPPRSFEASGPVPDASAGSLLPLAKEPLGVGRQPISAIPSLQHPELEATTPQRPVQSETSGLVAGLADPQAISQSATLLSQDDLAPTAVVPPPERLATPPAPAPGSFWERFFVDLDLPPSEASQTEPKLAPEPVNPLVAAQVTPALPAVSGPGPVLPQVTAIVENSDPSRATQNRHSEPAGPASPKARRLPAVDQPAMASPPVVLVEDWNGSLVDPARSADSALSSALSTGTATSSSSVPSSSASTAQAPSLPVPQVAAQLAGVLLRSTDKATELALAPEELGRVRLRMEPDAANPDRMVILISVERPETLDLFRRHAGELAEAIRAAGYSGADIGFDQQGQGQGQDRQQPSDMFGISKTPEDPGPTQPALRHATGANLDLRL